MDTFFYAYAIPWLWESNPMLFYVSASLILSTVIVTFMVFSTRNRWGLAFLSLMLIPAFAMVVWGISDDDGLNEVEAVSRHYSVQARSVACPERVEGDGCVAYTDAEGDYVVLKVASSDYKNGGRQVTTKRINDGPWPVTDTKETSR